MLDKKAPKFWSFIFTPLYDDVFLVMFVMTILKKRHFLVKKPKSISSSHVFTVNMFLSIK